MTTTNWLWIPGESPGVIGHAMSPEAAPLVVADLDARGIAHAEPRPEPEFYADFGGMIHVKAPRVKLTFGPGLVVETWAHQVGQLADHLTAARVRPGGWVKIHLWMNCFCLTEVELVYLRLEARSKEAEAKRLYDEFAANHFRPIVDVVQSLHDAEPVKPKDQAKLSPQACPETD